MKNAELHCLGDKEFSSTACNMNQLLFMQSTGSIIHHCRVIRCFVFPLGLQSRVDDDREVDELPARENRPMNVGQPAI